MIRALALLMVVGFLASPAFAEEDQVLSRHGSWEAHKLLREGQTACYAISKPKTKLPKKTKRDDTYFMVSNWPERQRSGEPSIVAGYKYSPGSKATVSLGKTKLAFFTKGDSAWLEDAAEERRLVTAMRKGGSLTVKGTSERGTITTDSYSLSGFGPALDKAAAACK